MRSVVTSMCLFVCLFVFLYTLTYLRNPIAKRLQIFPVCCLWRWFGPPLTALQYVMYILPVLVDDAIFSHDWRYGTSRDFLNGESMTAAIIMRRFQSKRPNCAQRYKYQRVYTSYGLCAPAGRSLPSTIALLKLCRSI